MQVTDCDVNIGQAIRSEQHIKVRRRVFRQCIESMIYEGILTPETQLEETFTPITISGWDEHDQPVAYRFWARRTFTFGMIRLLPSKPLMRVVGKTEQEAESITRFLMEIFRKRDVNEQKLASFAQELEQTLLKDTLAQYSRSERKVWLRGKGYDELEGDLMDGHPYHPSYKSRLGFDYLDHYAYGPEFKQEVQLLWLGIHKQYAHVKIDEDMETQQFFLDELGEEKREAFRSVFVQQGCDPEEYDMVPVHPWQWRKHIVPAFQADLHAKRIVELGFSNDRYRPQQSIRTFTNSSNPIKPYVKLAINVVNTSAARHLTPHSLASAPLISRWLKGMRDSDPFLKDEMKLVMLGEFATVCYDPPPSADLVEMVTFGVIGCMWRESLHQYLEPDEEAVPFNALSAKELDGVPFIDPWVQEHGIENWLRQLVEKSVLPVVHLLIKHGIALESHAQNMILIHRNGVPVRVALKDFHEDLIYCKPYLNDPEACPDFAKVHEFYATVEPNVMFHMDDPSLVRDLTLETLFLINLGQLALLLAEHYDFAESRFWMLLAQMIEQYQNRFPELKERFELFELFVPSILAEQLTKRRLYPDNVMHVHQVPNALYQARESLRSTPVGGDKPC